MSGRARRPVRTARAEPAQSEKSEPNPSGPPLRTRQRRGRRLLPPVGCTVPTRKSSSAARQRRASGRDDTGVRQVSEAPAGPRGAAIGPCGRYARPGPGQPRRLPPPPGGARSSRSPGARGWHPAPREPRPGRRPRAKGTRGALASSATLGRSGAEDAAGIAGGGAGLPVLFERSGVARGGWSWGDGLGRTARERAPGARDCTKYFVWQREGDVRPGKPGPGAGLCALGNL